MELKKALKATEDVISSWGKSKEKPQVGEALIDILDQADPKDRLAVLKVTLSTFNKRKPQTTGNFSFGSKWSDERWDSATNSVRDTKVHFNEALEKSRGHINAFAASVLEKMYSKETTHNMRVAMLSNILFSDDYCPFNYFRSNIDVTDKEFEAIRDSPKVTTHLETFLRNDVKFVMSLDRAAYFREMMIGRPEKEQLIILDLILQIFEAKSQQTSSTSPVDMLMTALMGGGVGGPNCNCPICRARRAQRGANG